jgi:integrase
MRRGSERLSSGQVQRAKGRPGKVAMLADGRGLYLRIGPNGSKSWIMRYQIDGRVHDMGLGPYPEIGLAEARDRCLAQRRVKVDGVDPIAVRKAERLAQRLTDAKAMSFRQCAEAYILAHRAGWKNPKHAAQWPATLTAYAYPVFGDLPVKAIDVGLVMKAVEPIWTTKAETASRIRGRIESVLDWATARGHRGGENPARWKGHLENLLPARSKVARVQHHAAVPYAELPAFVNELKWQNGVAARALEFAILTVARTGEVIGASWAEIDLGGRLWTIPAERMKAGREHRVPLSDAAIALLSNLERDPSRLFPISNMAMLMLLRRMGRGDLTVHGFRSAFSDWCAERTNFPSEVREMALAHVVGDKVEAAYRRGDLFDKRRQLAAAWARFCATTPTGGQVVPIRHRAGAAEGGPSVGALKSSSGRSR